LAPTRFLAGPLERAAELDLRRPLFYALRYTERLLGTPLPEAIRSAACCAAGHPASRPDGCFVRARPAPRSSNLPGRLSGIALCALCAAHHLRLPPYLLIPHLLRKAYMRRFATRQRARRFLDPANLRGSG